jgi:hypothetical protein
MRSCLCKVGTNIHASPGGSMGFSGSHVQLHLLRHGRGMSSVGRRRQKSNLSTSVYAVFWRKGASRLCGSEICEAWLTSDSEPWLAGDSVA